MSYVDFTKQPQTIISLCTGMRGLETGLERAGIDVRVKCYVEREAFVIENLVQQMEKGILAPAPIWSDLTKFPSNLFRGKIHGITGGIPCQPASVAGARKGADDERWLWGHVVTGENSIVGTVRPVFCFFENVPGLITIGYRKIRQDLEQLGYTVEEGIFSAEEVGAPHQRKRLFILAVANSYIEWQSQQKRLLEQSRERTVNRGKELDNANGIGSEPEYHVSTGRHSTELAGEEWGNPQMPEYQQSGNSRSRRNGLTTSSAPQLADSQHLGQYATEIGEGNEAREGSDAPRKDNGEQLEGCCDKLADTDNSRSREDTQCCQLRTEGIEQPSCNCRGANTGQDGQEQITRWPARPGQPQYDWEPPRVESSLGYVINGYNFREDLLRMAGNAVVPQTAELAFRTLITKLLP